MSVSPTIQPAPVAVPLCVDLDGTLIHSDLLWESFAHVLRTRPGRLLRVPWWFAHGRARLKRELAAGTTLDVATLPYNDALLGFLRAEKNRGRRILLVTASDRDLAQTVADHIGLFDETLGSDGVHNLRAERKAARLVERFGEKGYDYAGNSPPDLPVWARGRAAVVVNARPTLVARAHASGPVAAEFAGPTGTGATAWRELLRPAQWAKNALVLAPWLFVSPRMDPATLPPTLLTALAFCLCASAAGVTGDILNLTADRRDAARRGRPLAAGRALLSEALIVAAVLFAAGLAVGGLVSFAVFACLAFYVVAAGAHTRWMREAPLYGTLVLAATHALRLVAGAAAAGSALPGLGLAIAALAFAALGRFAYFQEP